MLTLLLLSLSADALMIAAVIYELLLLALVGIAAFAQWRFEAAERKRAELPKAVALR